MNNTEPQGIQAMNLVTKLKEEIEKTLTEISNIDVTAPGQNGESGTIIGPMSIVLSKVSTLKDMMYLTQSVIAFENVDKRVVSMATAGNDLYRALKELSPKEANDFTIPILKSWEEACIRPQ